MTATREKNISVIGNFTIQLWRLIQQKTEEKRRQVALGEKTLSLSYSSLLLLWPDCWEMRKKNKNKKRR